MVRRAHILAVIAAALPLAAPAQSPHAGIAAAEACAFKGAPGTGKILARESFADPRVHVTYYRLRPTLTASYLSGDVLARLVCLNDSISSVTFDLAGTMTIDSVLGPGGRLPYTQYLEGFQVQLGRTYGKGDTLTVDTFYRGVPAPTGFGSFMFASVDGAPWIWTLSEPYGARDWWPCKDDNSDKADSVDMEVTVPSGLKAGSNGTLVATEVHGDGTTTFHWSERYPIAAYLVSLAVADYVEIDDWFRYSPSDSMPIINYVLPPSAGDSLRALGETKSMLRIFSDAYGLYPFIREKYGHSRFAEGGAMEHQTMTSTNNYYESTISHELAHQWFGDLITCANWPNLWLNEGFAVYSECVFLERYYGEAAYTAHIRGVMSNALNAQGTLYVQDTTTVANLFDADRVYDKGAWTLHMLRHVIGDSAFFRSLRAYVADPRFRYRSATTEGFRSVCESVSGMDLGYFFDEWVYGEGHPQYSYRWSVIPAGGTYNVSLNLTQKGSSAATPFFRMPVDVRLVAGSRDTTFQITPLASGETFSFALPFYPDTLQLDPDMWILRDVLPPETILPGAYALAPNYPNPFNPATVITFSLPHRSVVSVTVYDPLGREIAVLARGRWEAGTHSVRWEGTDARGIPVASGTYFCRFAAGDYAATRAMILLR